MSQANALEELMLSLINDERGAAGLDPLTFNGDLNEAAEDHSDWMLDTDRFSHTGQNGSTVRDRTTEAGYELEGNWTIGENIGWQSERGAEGLEDDVRDIHQSLMNSPGHRANILDPDYDEIGIGIERGDFDGFDGVMITQNFGATDAVSEPENPPVTSEPPVMPEPEPETPVVPDPEPEPPIAENPDPVPTEPPAPTEPAPEPPVAETPDAETPQVDDPFDVDAFIAELTALLDDLFASLDFGYWHHGDLVTVPTLAEDTAQVEERGDHDRLWFCDTEDFALDTSSPMTFDVDFF